MTHPNETTGSTQTLLRWARGIGTAARATGMGFGNMITDLRILARQWKKDPVIRQRAVDGFQMLLRADEEVGRRIYFHAMHEKEETAFIQQNIRRTDICFDIGANLGYYTLLLASLAREGSVHSFEPIPLNYHLLCATCLSNRFEHVEVNACAVGDVDTEVEFVVAQDSGYSSLLDTGRMPIAGRIRVPMNTLDDYCKQRQIGRVDFLKVDVEGAEEKVIAGASQLLSDSTRKPRLIMLEIYEPMLRRYSSSIDQIVGRMQDYGYHPFVVHQGKTVPFEQQHYDKFYNVFFALRDFQQ